MAPGRPVGRAGRGTARAAGRATGVERRGAAAAAVEAVDPQARAPASTTDAASGGRVLLTVVLPAVVRRSGPERRIVPSPLRRCNRPTGATTATSATNGDVSN